MVSSIHTLNKPAGGKISIMNSFRDTVQIGSQSFEVADLNPTLERFNYFWALMDTVKKHGYLRAATSVIGRSAVGAWWSLRKNPEYAKRNAPERHRKRLLEFYMFQNKPWDNIKDYQNIAYKIMIGVMYLRFFGQAAFQIIRDDGGAPLGLDFLPGLLVPNVDSKGYFKSPAFIQYPTNDPVEKVEFANAKDIVYLLNPDMEGSPLGGSDIEALTDYTLPLDIYLMLGAREYMKNRDKPEVVYSLPTDISDEAFDDFVRELEARHGGARNLGRSPIAVQGDFKITELRPLPDKLPYQESRKEAREEELAVAGVSGAKLGLTESLSSANLRESRREFHETSLVPLFKLVELAFYEQIHQREFGYNGWDFVFNTPDFLTAVEKATVHMRYQQMGALNPNEIRFELGYQPRTDEAGDKYIDEEPEEEEEPEDEYPVPPGSPPEGRPIEPDDPSQIGEPTLDDQDPERGDQHDEETRESWLKELKTWHEFVSKRIKKNRSIREFKTESIPMEVASMIQGYLNRAETLDDVNLIFNDAFDALK